MTVGRSVHLSSITCVEIFKYWSCKYWDNFIRLDTVDKKSCIRETLNLFMCANSSTDTKTDKNKQKKKQKNHVTCVTCQVSCVAGHLSPIIKTTTTATTYSTHANFPLFYNMLLCMDPEKINCKEKTFKQQQQKSCLGMPISVIRSLTRSVQSTEKQGFQKCSE